MKWLESPATVAMGCGLILITNLAILGSAASNRRNGPNVELSLTERELALPEGRQQEDSGLLLSLRLTHETPGAFRRTARWRNYELPSVEYAWLDRAKLQKLGIRVDLDPSDPEATDYYRHAMTRRAYVVLEYDGTAWSEWIAGREAQVRELRRGFEEGTTGASALADAEAVLALDRTMRSRLFPVDAGTDPAALRHSYPDRHRYAVVAGLLRPKVIRAEDETRVLRGDVWALVVRWIQVPKKLRHDLEAFLPEETHDQLFERQREEARSSWPLPAAPRFSTVLAFGRRHEPWLVSVARLEQRDTVRPIRPGGEAQGSD